MQAESELRGPQPQERVICVTEEIPAGLGVSNALQFDAHPLPTKEEYEQNRNMYVTGKSFKQVIPTIATTAKTFELKYKEPFKIRLPHIVTSEPSSISATLHISVEPLSASSKDGLPQIRIFDRGSIGSPLGIPCATYWNADFPRMIGSSSPFAFDQQPIPEMGAASPYFNKLAPSLPLTRCCGFIFYPCWKENINTKFLTSMLGISNIVLITCLVVLTFYGLPATESAYSGKMVAITAWSQMTSHALIFLYKMYCTAEVLELPKLYESLHMAGTAVLMVVAATMFFGVYGLPEDSWHMSILCIVIALVALGILLKM